MARPRNNRDIRMMMTQYNITQRELADAIGMWQPSLCALLNKTPLSAEERQRILDGIEKIKNERWNEARDQFEDEHIR